RNVRQGDIGHRGVQDLHERGGHDRRGDEPRVMARLPRRGVAPRCGCWVNSHVCSYTAEFNAKTPRRDAGAESRFTHHVSRFTARPPAARHHSTPTTSAPTAATMITTASGISYAVTCTDGTTDIPGPSTCAASTGSSKRILTGMRCTT